MNIVPSRWHDLSLREYMAFYLTIVATPFLALSAYANIKIGSAKLQPIPEGYVPKEEEYERHPISRYYSGIRCTRGGRKIFKVNVYRFAEIYHLIVYIGG